MSLNSDFENLTPGRQISTTSPTPSALSEDSHRVYTGRSTADHGSKIIPIKLCRGHYSPPPPPSTLLHAFNDTISYHALETGETKAVEQAGSHTQIVVRRFAAAKISS